MGCERLHCVVRKSTHMFSKRFSSHTEVAPTSHPPSYLERLPLALRGRDLQGMIWLEKSHRLPAERGCRDSEATIVVLVRVRICHNAKVSLGVHGSHLDSQQGDPLLCLSCGSWSGTGCTLVWKQLQKATIRWFSSTLLNLCRIATACESFCVPGSGSTIPAKYFKSSFKTREAAHMESVAMETWAAVSSLIVDVQSVFEETAQRENGIEHIFVVCVIKFHYDSFSFASLTITSWSFFSSNSDFPSHRTDIWVLDCYLVNYINGSWI